MELTDPDKDLWMPRIWAADVLFFGGGNTFHLMHWFIQSGLREQLPELLKTRVYAGISAGSCVAGPTIYNSVQNLFDETYALEIEEGLGLTDFQFVPHLNSYVFPKIRRENILEAAKELTEKVYAVDDETALVVVDGVVEVMGDGEWVAELVAAVTQDKTLPRAVRKQHATEHLREMDHDMLLLKSADMLHNLSELIEDVKERGDAAFEIFKGGKEQKLREFEERIGILEEVWAENPLVEELREGFGRLGELLKTA